MKETMKDLARTGRRALGVATVWALIGPVLLAFSGSARALAAECLPQSGTERIVLLTTLTAGAIEIIRLGRARHVLARRLREVEAKLAQQQSGDCVTAGESGDTSLRQSETLQTGEASAPRQDISPVVINGQ